MSRGPTRTIDGLATYLEANQKAMEGHEDAVCLILYRSELATLLGALRALERGPAPHRVWAALHPIPPIPVGTNGRMLDPSDRGPEGTGPLMREMTHQEINDAFGVVRNFIPPAAAAPTPPTEPKDHWTVAGVGVDSGPEWMTEEELLAGLEGLCGPLEPKHYGEGRQGPVGAPRPSACAPGGPSCSPGFGIANSTPSTASSSDSLGVGGGGSHRMRKG